jgi:protease I
MVVVSLLLKAEVIKVMDLTGKTIALLSGDEFEDAELTEPKAAIEAVGAVVQVISEKTGELTGKNGTKVTVDKTLDDVTEADFDGLLLPGGVGNPDHMRMNETAVNFVRDFFSSHKPVAAICHAPWLLIEAGVVSGRTVTSWPSLKTDLQNAGATWVDQEVVVDQGLVTSRKPDDIEAFNAKAIEEFGEGKHEAQVA